MTEVIQLRNLRRLGELKGSVDIDRRAVWIDVDIVLESDLAVG